MSTYILTSMFPDGFDEAIFSSGISIAPTIESLKYPTDWTEDTAKYLDENLDELIAAALNLAGVEGNLSDMLKSNINFLTGANLNTIVTLLTDLLDKLNTEIVNNAGVLIGADLDALRSYKADEEKEYTTVEFAQELAKILNVIPEVVGLVFFGDNFEIFNYGNGNSVGTVTGAHGYAEGLAPILEALGCKNLPEIYDVEDFDSAAAVEAILVSIANRFDEILADPIGEILDVLPNIIFFINANGISVSVENLLSSVTGFMGLLKESFGVDVDLVAIINNAINGLLPEGSNVTVDLLDLDLENVFVLVQEILGLDLTMASDILVNFCVGKIEAFDSISTEYGFRMVYNDDYARYDMITILVTIALMVVSNEQNAAALDEMIGTEIMSALKTVFGSVEIEYAEIDWDYCWDENGEATGDTIPVIESAITYPNDFTEEDAKYHPQRNVITRAVGIEHVVDVEGLNNMSFVETDLEVRRERFLKRAYTERNQDLENAKKHWDYILGAAEKYVLPARKDADIILNGEASIDVYKLFIQKVMDIVRELTVAQAVKKEEELELVRS